MHTDAYENMNMEKNGKELAAIVEEHPYYSITQFWLLSGYKINQHPAFEKQALITSLFFKNRQWLNWQLSQNNRQENKNGNTVASSLVSNDKIPVSALAPDTKPEKQLAFEPLHTRDYFASQGIKISEDTIVNDKLGTQLKSFTEWLKSMKKIHSEKLTEGDEQTDKIIQHIAEGSNAKINVVTEAMAEVLVNQGKIAQAIEMYNKLSLNYPDGSAYFAAKIKSLKQ